MKQSKKQRRKSKIIVEDYDSKKVMAITNILIGTPNDDLKEENEVKDLPDMSDEVNITLNSDADFLIMDE